MTDNEHQDDESRPKQNGDLASLVIDVPGADFVEVPALLPVLPVRDVVVFPGVTMPLAIGRTRSLAALEEAGQDGYLLVVSQRDPLTENPGIDDLYEIGTIVRVMRIIDARREDRAENRVVADLAIEGMDQLAQHFIIEPGPCLESGCDRRSRGEAAR